MISVPMRYPRRRNGVASRMSGARKQHLCKAFARANKRRTRRLSNNTGDGARAQTCKPQTWKPQTCKPQIWKPQTCKPQTWEALTWQHRLGRHRLAKCRIKKGRSSDRPSSSESRAMNAATQRKCLRHCGVSCLLLAVMHCVMRSTSGMKRPQTIRASSAQSMRC